MAKKDASAKAITAGITEDTTKIWKALCTRPGWWTAARMTNHWAPCFRIEEVQAHLDTLAKGHFVDVDNSGFSTTYAVTRSSLALPGLEEYLRAALEAASRPAPMTAPPRHDRMSGTYEPPPALHSDAVNPRPGADDFSKLLSRGHRC